MVLAWVVLLALGAAQPPATPQAAVDQLLAADRQFSAAGAQLDAVAAISAMFADDVIVWSPTAFARGKAKAVEALGAIPDMVKSRAQWTPARGGLSADGQQGFTFGYMTLLRPDGSRAPFKYLSYWVKQKDGWRVVVYKRSRGAEVSGPHEPMPAALPSRLVEPTASPAVIARHRESLDRAERAFSDEAQKIGLGPAFAKFGSGDAVNMGGPTASRFVVGAEAIGKMIGAGVPATSSPVTWAPDDVLVASSGDLGVTVGLLRRNAPPAPGQSPTIPFITVWRRPGPADPWRYIAE
jgi:ketosteroid isomerase-like protein